MRAKFQNIFTRKSYTHEGLTMYYREGGEGQQLLFLPGAGTRASTYREALMLLAEHHHVLAPTLPGFGSSSSPKDVWSAKQYAQFLKSFADSLSLRNVILMGSSFGGGVALELAALSGTEHFSKLVLINSLGISPSLSTRHFHWRYFVKRPLGNLRYPKGWKILLRLTKDFTLLLAKKPSNIPKIPRAIATWVYRDFQDFEKVNIPTLIVWSDRDEVYPKEIALRLQKKLPNSQLVWVDGNHDWVLFTPELLPEKLA